MDQQQREFLEDFSEDVHGLYQTITVRGVCVRTHPARFMSDDIAVQQATIKTFCSECPVHWECLKYSLAAREYGIWGGTTEKMREKILKRGRDAARKVLKTDNLTGGWTKVLWSATVAVAHDAAYSSQRRHAKRGRPPEIPDESEANPMSRVKPSAV